MNSGSSAFHHNPVNKLHDLMSETCNISIPFLTGSGVAGLVVFCCLYFATKGDPTLLRPRVGELLSAPYFKADRGVCKMIV